jgi:hypothetical protein
VPPRSPYIYIYSNLVDEKFQHYIKKRFLKTCAVVLGPRVCSQNWQYTTMKAATGCPHQLVKLSHWIQAINVKKECDCDVRPSFSRIIILRRSSGKTSDSSDRPTCCEHADGHASGILMLVFRTFVSVLESRTGSACCLASGTENHFGVQITDGKKRDRKGEKPRYKKGQKIKDERWN